MFLRKAIAVSVKPLFFRTFPRTFSAPIFTTTQKIAKALSKPGLEVTKVTEEKLPVGTKLIGDLSHDVVPDTKLISLRRQLSAEKLAQLLSNGPLGIFSTTQPTSSFNVTMTTGDEASLINYDSVTLDTITSNAALSFKSNKSC